MSSIAVQLPPTMAKKSELRPVPSIPAAKPSADIGLDTKALIVHLCISMWTNRKHDKTVSKEVEESKDAEKDAGRYNKVLVSKEALKDVQKCVSAIRNFHYDNSLRWSDNGERLLPAANYFTYVNQLNTLRAEFDEAVRVFLFHYDSYVQEARIRLGKMFNISDYPSRSEIEQKFRISPVFMPVPSTDFRVGLNSNEAEKLKKAAEFEINERLKDVMDEVWKRVKDQLVSMQKLSDKDSYFKNAMFTNLEELVNVLPRLNVTGDIHLQRISEEMKSLCGDPDTIRCDDTIRNIKAQKVESIMERYKDFF